MFTTIIKRDGTPVPFDITKIQTAIYKAAQSVGGTDSTKAQDLAYLVQKSLGIDPDSDSAPTSINIEDVQDAVERTLIKNGYADTAKAYILYRDRRSKIRKLHNGVTAAMRKMMVEDAEGNDAKRENANIDGNSVCGTMLRIAGEQTKAFTLDNLYEEKWAQHHREGRIHLHALDLSSLCAGYETQITVIDPDGKLKTDSIGHLFDSLGEGVHYLKGWKIFDGTDFTDLINVAVKPSKGLIRQIHTAYGTVELTDEHIVPVHPLDTDSVVEWPVQALRCGDRLQFQKTAIESVDTEVGELEWVPITRLLLTSYHKEHVFDVETGSHYWCADGFKIHNCPNCLQIPIDKLFEHGFSTGHGYLRQPATIGSAATLIAIVIQSDQNDTLR